VPAGAAGVRGTVEVLEAYRDGLADLDGFSHIVLLYHLHLSEGYKLRVVPFMDTVERGLFATRAPKRPNAIGLSVVQLDRIEDGILHVQNVDIVDGTPLLDIKPYVPEFDSPGEIRTGWLEEVRRTVLDRRADDRFAWLTNGRRTVRLPSQQGRRRPHLLGGQLHHDPWRRARTLPGRRSCRFAAAPCGVDTLLHLPGSCGTGSITLGLLTNHQSQ